MAGEGSSDRDEATAPTANGRSLGRFYTPSRIATLLVRWALPRVAEGRPPRVLDPAAGEGAFLAAAAEELDDHFGSAPGMPSAQLVGVDVDRPALETAAARLSERAGPVHLHEASFFDIAPGTTRDVDVDVDVDVGGEAAGAEDRFAEFDAVVGNPPFVRAEDLSPDVEHYRDHLAAFGPDGEAPYLDGEARVGRRSDAYVYFVTHATRFLRDGGRLGVVLPSKWLASDYGEDFQRFLLDHYAVTAVVGFDGRAFDDALVDTVLLLAERRVDTGAGHDGPVRFVRFTEPVAVDDALGAIDEATGSQTDGALAVRTAGPARTVSLPGSSVEPGKLAPYLRAPEAVLDLLAHPGFVPLAELAAVSRGVMTGANRFFFVDPETADTFGIDDRFLRPALKSVRGVETRALGPGDVERSILDVHAYVERVAARGRRGEGSERQLAARVRDALGRDGHDGLLAYVRRGESEGWDEGRTCGSRRVWFDLGDLPAPDMFLPKLLRERVFVVRNEAGAVPSNAIDCLTAREGIDAAALAGALESTACRAIMEVWGRDEAGMLQLMTYETSTLPVPDVRAFSRPERRRVAAAAAALAAGDGGARRALDAAIGDAVDLEPSPERLRRVRERLLRRRVDAGSAGAGVLVDPDDGG